VEQAVLAALLVITQDTETSLLAAVAEMQPLEFLAVVVVLLLLAVQIIGEYLVELLVQT
jgi:hypothetical protein